VNVACGQAGAHLFAAMSEQLVLFTHAAQVPSWPWQLESHENPDELMLPEISLSQPSLQLELLPHPATAISSPARQPIHTLFTSFSPVR